MRRGTSRQGPAPPGGEALVPRAGGGVAVLHALLVTMFSEKGGQIARLVDWRANTSRRTIYRYDVLRAVARQARPAIHRILQTAPELAKRASPRFGVTPLHLAAYNGNIGAVDLLLGAGADIASTRHPLGMMPLAAAAAAGRQRRRRRESSESRARRRRRIRAKTTPTRRTWPPVVTPWPRARRPTRRRPLRRARGQP